MKEQQKMYLFSTEFGYQIFKSYKFHDNENILIFDDAGEEKYMSKYQITSTIKGVSEVSLTSMKDVYLPDHAIMSDDFNKLREYMLKMVMV